MKPLKKLRKLLISIIVIILLELTVFNFRYYTTKMSGLEHETIELTKENLSENEYDGFKFEKTYSIVLNKKVRGLKLNLLVDSENKIIEITPKFKDQNAKYTEKELEFVKYSPKYKNREYIVLNSQENCLNIELYMASTGNFYLESIEINTWYFEFNIFRVCMLILISSIILYKKEINNYFEKNPREKKNFYKGFIIISTILIAFYLMGYGKVYENSSWDTGMVLEDMYKKLTESIMHGKITLDFPEKDKANLLTLQNYKDYSERVEAGYPYLYDAAFYNGNYYCYYGIIPVLTVLLPIAVFTGIYCYSNVVCLVYGTLVSILILKIYLKLLKKFKIEFNFILEFLGYIALLLSMELYILKFQPNFYQAVDLCGIFWGLFAFWLIMSLENNQNTEKKLFGIGLSYGFMVLTRPIYVFYIIPIIVGVYKYIIQNKKINLKNLVVFIIPIAIMATFQMWYNYARFDNIFEFGQFHQITTNDPSSQELETGMAIDGLLSYFFNPPEITRHFPFLYPKWAGVKNGNIIFTMEVLGIFWHPFLLILLTARKRIKNSTYKKKLLIYTTIFWIISIIILILDTCWAGMNQRYLTDVLPALTLLALIYWLSFIAESKNKEVKKDRITIYKTFCVISVVVMSIYAFIRLESSLLNTGDIKHINKRVIEYTIEHSLEFYK